MDRRSRAVSDLLVDHPDDGPTGPDDHRHPQLPGVFQKRMMNVSGGAVKE